MIPLNQAHAASLADESRAADVLRMIVAGGKKISGAPVAMAPQTFKGTPPSVYYPLPAGVKPLTLAAPAVAPAATPASSSGASCASCGGHDAPVATAPVPAPAANSPAADAVVLYPQRAQWWWPVLLGFALFYLFGRGAR